MEPQDTTNNPPAPAETVTVTISPALTEEQKRKIMASQSAFVITSGAAVLIGAGIGLAKGYKWGCYLLLIFILAPAAGSIAGAVAYNAKK